jgi:hypothetical protein
MAALQEQEHPADLLAEAERLEAEAERQMVTVRTMRADAARLRSRAGRLLHGGGVTVTRRAEPDDPLLGAAALAAEDLQGLWTSADLAKALRIVDSRRALRLCVRLRDLGHVEQHDGRFRSADPEEGLIRDAVIELGEFTCEQLGERVGLRPESLSGYLADLREKGIIAGEDDERMAYQPTGRENVVTRRFHRPAPEQEVVDRSIRRGSAVDYTGRPMIETGGNRRQAGERKSRGGKTKKRQHRNGG